MKKITVFVALTCWAGCLANEATGQNLKGQAMGGAHGAVAGQGNLNQGKPGMPGQMTPAQGAFDSAAFTANMIQQFDKDGDGALNQSELQACLEMLHRHVLSQQAALQGQAGPQGRGPGMAAGAMGRFPGFMPPFGEFNLPPGLMGQGNFAQDSNSQFSQDSNRMSRFSSSGQRSMSGGRR